LCRDEAGKFWERGSHGFEKSLLGIQIFPKYENNYKLMKPIWSFKTSQKKLDLKKIAFFIFIVK